MKTIVNYFYKIVVFVIYSTLVSTGVYYICSHLAPIPKLDMYFDLEWLLPKIISENKTMGIIGVFPKQQTEK